MGKPGILLDRDGTINVDYQYVGHIERIQLIPGAADAIARFNRAGIPVAIITNQSGVARGFYPERNVHAVHDHIARELARHGAHVDLFLYSPHHPDGFVQEYARHSDYHKPGPGMAYAAAQKLDLDLSKSWVVGDRPSDIIMAYHAGANSVYLGGDLDTWSDGNLMPHQFPSLAAAAGFIIERITGVPQSVFPTMHYNTMIGYFTHYANEIKSMLDLVDMRNIDTAAYALVTAYGNHNKVFIAGNGGAAAIAAHFKCDHSKNVGTEKHWHPQVIDLTADVPLITAIANDIGYDSIFSYQLERSADLYDMLIVFSTSGYSANIVRALQCAREQGMSSIAVLACTGGKAMDIADITIHIPTSNYGVAEDMMQIIMHVLAQYIRQSKLSEHEIKGIRF